MGYYERKAAAALVAGVAVVLGACLVAVGPWMAGNTIAGPALGWVFEACYVAGVAWLIRAQIRRARLRRDAAASRLQAFAPRFNPALHCYSHGTCTIRHRSIGAAARCRSAV